TDSLAKFFLEQYAYNSIEERASVLHPDVWACGAADDSARQVFESAFERVAHLDPQAQFLSVFLRLHLQTVLERLDRSTMAESLEAIGCYFGGRDHTTVLHAHRTIQHAVKEDPQLAALLDDIANEVKNAHY
ncbi:MAG: hypothetical protein IID43_05930, partial [Planctomycetes bacterium]|nr:hypothetical protein [Planctomycetota bacterium]